MESRVQDQKDASSVTDPRWPAVQFTGELLDHLQVCRASVEALAYMTLPAEAHKVMGRLEAAVDGLIAAADFARRGVPRKGVGISVGKSHAPRG